MPNYQRRINLTLAGFGGGGGSRAAPPPPAAVVAAPPAGRPTPTAAPTQSRASAGGGQSTPANIRNSGGARGTEVMGSVTRALKTLTGQ